MKTKAEIVRNWLPRYTGTAIEGMMVAGMFLRNKNTTMMTRPEAIRSVRSISSNDARMVVDRSTPMVTSMAGEIDALSCGISASTRSTTTR